MATATINKRTVDAAKPGQAASFLWDDTLAGFGVKVTPKGRKVFLYQYRIAEVRQAERTAPRRYTIGPLGEWTPATARHEAERLAHLAAQGIDPLQERRERIAGAEEARRARDKQARRDAELQFGMVAERWLIFLEEMAYSPSHIATSRSCLRVHFLPRLAGRPVPQITGEELRAIVASVSVKQPATRINIRKTATALFEWAKEEWKLPDNPAAALHQSRKSGKRGDRVEARERSLNDVELTAICRAVDDLPAPWPSFFRLAILTGKRRTLVAEIDWRELDRDGRAWSVVVRAGAKGKPDLVPLSDAVIAELEKLAADAHKQAGDGDVEGWPKSGFVLTGKGKRPIGNFGKVKRALDAAITKARRGEPLPAWRIHDFRRTIATGMQRLGIRLEVSEAVLNHKGKSRSGVAGIYHRYDWTAEKREAMEKWALHITQIVAASKAENVVSLEALLA